MRRLADELSIRNRIPICFVPIGHNSVGAAGADAARAGYSTLAEGLSSKQTAKKLGISPQAVDFRGANVMRKLGARKATEVVAKVLGVDDGPAQGEYLVDRNAARRQGQRLCRLGRSRLRCKS